MLQNPLVQRTAEVKKLGKYRKYFTKTLFPEEISRGLNKTDGVIAICFYLFYIVFMFLLLNYIKNTPLYERLQGSAGKTIYSIIFGAVMDLPAILGIALILRVRKQDISTIGIQNKGTRSSLMAGGILFLIYAAIYFSRHGFTSSFIYDIIFYLCLIGFYEEIVFRGFLWPRMSVIFGKIPGIIISGVFFGFMHVPIDIVWNNKSFLETVVLGQTSNISIMGGLLYTVFITYIYTRNNNILLPAFIHGILDLSATV